MNSTIEILNVKSQILENDEKVSGQVRDLLKNSRSFLVNLMASPGAGKTTFLLQLIDRLKDRYSIGVLEADVDSDVDAKTVSEAGAKAIQVHTGGSCHMDAAMTLRGLEHLGCEELDLIILENVGNLVCPAEFDVGADLKMMLLSVPEGDDKPLKYPLMFTVSDLCLINKIDTKPIFDFDTDAFKNRVHALNPNALIMEMSAKTGEGVDAAVQWLIQQIEDKKKQRCKEESTL